MAGHYNWNCYASVNENLFSIGYRSRHEFSDEDDNNNKAVSNHSFGLEKIFANNPKYIHIFVIALFSTVIPLLIYFKSWGGF